jgi:hypothetical protein
MDGFVYTMMDKESEHSTSSTSEDEITAYQQKIWDSLSKHYDIVEDVQISSSLVILMALDQSKIALTTNQISETISKRNL